MSNSVFISYSHHDTDFMVELRGHLTPLKLAGLIDVWHDELLEPGQPFDPAIEAKLSSSEVVILLLSSDFLASNYCTQREMVRAFERARQGTARVVPIVCRPCQWKIVPINGGKLGDFVALPKNGKPVSTYAQRDVAWDEIAGILANMLSPTSSTATVGKPELRQVRTFTVHFPQGSAAPGLTGGEVILAAAKAISQDEYTRILIVGHCDASERGVDQGHKLSIDRAQIVWRQLTSTGVTNRCTMTWQAQGTAFPVGSDPALNRRVTIEISDLERDASGSVTLPSGRVIEL